jgi:DNA-directed RNA polymerase beta subunit
MDILRTSSKKDALKLYRVDREDLPQEFSEGVVNRVRVFYKNTEEVRNRYAKLIEYYNKDHEEYLDNIKGGINTNVPEYNIPMPNKGENDLVILITITSTINAEMGSKITNRYASKGTISDVLPDDQMPRINDESGLPLQILIPPQSTINRKNIAQIFEMNLCLLCKMAYDKNEENIKLKNFNSVRESLNKLYVTDKFNNYSDENLTEFHKSFDEYYSIEVNSIDKTYTQRVMSELCEYFGIDQDGVYLYDPVESERITIQKVTVGITEIMRLHFIPQFKAKATSDILDSENTVLYGGSTRSGGQKIGEMESWQVHVHGIENPINNIVKNASGISLDDYTNIALLNQARVAGLEYCLYQQLIKD